MMQQLELHLEEALEMEISQISAILPDQCLFCKTSKYQSNTKTSEKLHRVPKFRAYKTVRAGSSLDVEQNADMSEVTRNVIGIRAKDLISSEAK